MTTFEKSKLLWAVGGVLGAVVAALSTKSAVKTAAGAVAGMILLGGIGDVVLERQRDARKLSLIPVN